MADGEYVFTDFLLEKKNPTCINVSDYGNNNIVFFSMYDNIIRIICNQNVDKDEKIEPKRVVQHQETRILTCFQVFT